MPSSNRQRIRDRNISRGDNRPGKPYEPFVYGRVISLADGGATKYAIARQLEIPRSSVYSILDRRDQLIRRMGHRAPLAPRATVITLETGQALLAAVRQRPKTSYQELIDEYSLAFSRSTLRRFFNDKGIQGWICKLRPHLTDRHARLRLEWCQRFRGWTSEDWKRVIFSDESTVQRGKGGRREYCLRTHEQKWDKNCLQTSTKSGGITCMVWGAFSVELGRSELITMRRRQLEGGVGSGIDSECYTDALEEGLLPFFNGPTSTLKDRAIFQQDNAPIHKSTHTLNWLDDRSITHFDWPPYSPDLNPIEHIWVHMKTKIRQNNPELDTIGTGAEAVQAVGNAARLAWWEVDWSIFESVVESMPRRVQACIDSDGWHTKY